MSLAAASGMRGGKSSGSPQQGGGKNTQNPGVPEGTIYGPGIEQRENLVYMPAPNDQWRAPQNAPGGSWRGQGGGKNSGAPDQSFAYADKLAGMFPQYANNILPQQQQQPIRGGKFSVNPQQQAMGDRANMAQGMGKNTPAPSRSWDEAKANGVAEQNGMSNLEQEQDQQPRMGWSKKGREINEQRKEEQMSSALRAFQGARMGM